jgi:N-formylglutamate amidohydrolase
MSTVARSPRFACFFIIALLCPPVVAQESAVEKRPASAKAIPSDPLVDVQRGTIPIIICAPHGGREAIPGVPPRKNRPVNPPKGTPNWVTGTDVNTHELAEGIVAELEKRLGGKPYFVMARFQRKFIDPNRASEHSYEVPEAKFYYDAYHDTIAEYCREVQKKWGTGLVIDVHGQASFKDQILIGTVGGETVKLLIERHGRGALVGQDGLVGMMLDAGTKVKPDLNSENLNVAAGLNGGYTVQTYGSHQPTALEAVQFEYGSNYRVKENIAKSAEDTAEGVAAFYKAYIVRKKPENAAAQ